MEQTNCKWTDLDTHICERAEASGLAVNAQTGEPLTYEETKKISAEYQKVKSEITIHEFLKGKVSSIPYEF